MVAATLILLVGLFNLIQQFQKKYQVQKEISDLESEISSLQGKNKDILDVLNYFRTPEYKQRQARSVLNLQKPGEFAVALPPGEETPADDSGGLNQNHESNLAKWWKYFFE